MTSTGANDAVWVLRADVGDCACTLSWATAAAGVTAVAGAVGSGAICVTTTTEPALTLSTAHRLAAMFKAVVMAPQNVDCHAGVCAVASTADTFKVMAAGAKVGLTLTAGAAHTPLPKTYCVLLTVAHTLQVVPDTHARQLLAQAAHEPCDE